MRHAISSMSSAELSKMMSSSKFKPSISTTNTKPFQTMDSSNANSTSAQPVQQTPSNSLEELQSLKASSIIDEIGFQRSGFPLTGGYSNQTNGSERWFNGSATASDEPAITSSKTPDGASKSIDQRGNPDPLQGDPGSIVNTLI